MPTSLVQLGARLFTRSRSVLSLWERHPRVVTFPDVPWVPLARPGRDLTVAIRMSSSRSIGCGLCHQSVGLVQRAIEEPGTIVDLGIGGILSH
ncbi:MAG: hypothetical protein ACXWWM_06190 [Candidatus Deferrimicrobiaceae bacterium]